MNPDKKGEEVTEKLAGLSEELMNTPQPFRGGVSRARSRPGSTEQEMGAGEQRGLSSENLGDRLTRGKGDERGSSFSSEIAGLKGSVKSTR